MQETRFMFCAAASALAIVCVHPAIAQQEYPAGSIRVIYPFVPGSGNEGIARVLSQRFTMVSGQAAVVDNRTGAGGTIGADIVAKSAPDGHTLLVTTASLAVNATLYPKLPFDVRRDLAPITQIVSTGIVMERTYHVE